MICKHLNVCDIGTNEAVDCRAVAFSQTIRNFNLSNSCMLHLTLFDYVNYLHFNLDYKIL